MEINGILVSSSGTSAAQGTYFCDEMGFSGYRRTWTNTNKEVMIFAAESISAGIKSYTWKFSDLSKATIYYHSVSLDGLPTVNPWDKNVGWAIGEDEIGNAPIPLLEKFSNPNIIVDVEDPIITYDEETNEKITTVVTRYTDASTGNVRSDTQVTTEKVLYKTQEVERGLQANLSIGKVYRFSFISEFKTLGYVPPVIPVDSTEETEESVGTNGIYQLTKMMNYADLISLGIDLYENLYRPVGLTQDLFEHDQATIQASPIYELTDPANTSNILYIPAAFIDGTPDSSVEEYNQLMLIIDLGYYADASIVAELEETISNILLCKFGIDNRSILPGSITEDNPEGTINPNQSVNAASVVTNDSTWMHTSDYNKLDEARAIIQSSDDAIQAYNDLTTKLASNDIYVTFTEENINRYIGRMIKVGNNWVKITEENKSTFIGHSYLMCVSASTYRDINRKLLTQIEAYENIIENGKQIGS